MSKLRDHPKRSRNTSLVASGSCTFSSRTMHYSCPQSCRGPARYAGSSMRISCVAGPVQAADRAFDEPAVYLPQARCRDLLLEGIFFPGSLVVHRTFVVVVVFVVA